MRQLYNSPTDTLLPSESVNLVLSLPENHERYTIIRSLHGVNVFVVVFQDEYDVTTKLYSSTEVQRLIKYLLSDGVDIKVFVDTAAIEDVQIEDLTDTIEDVEIEDLVDALSKPET